VPSPGRVATDFGRRRGTGKAQQRDGIFARRIGAVVIGVVSIATAAAAQFSFQLPLNTDVDPAPRRLALLEAADGTAIVGGDNGLAVVQRSGRRVAVIARIPTESAVRALAVGGVPSDRHVAWGTRGATSVTIAPLGPRGAIGVDQKIELPGRASAIVALPLGDGAEPVFAVAHSQGVALLRRDREKRFRATAIAAVELAPDLRVTDANGDGNADLLAVDEARGRLLLLLGDGDGGFSASDEIAANLSPTRVVASDLDGDAALELLSIGTLGLSVHERNRRGAFETPRVIVETPHLSDLAVADFDLDGHLDVAYTSRSRGAITFLYGRGGGKLGDATSYLVGHGPEALLVMANDAGLPPDVLVANEISGDVTFLRNRGNRLFTGSPTAMAAITPLTALALADFDSDSHLDIALVSAESGRLQVFLGNATGTFAPLSSRPIVRQPLDLVAADMDSDGRPDLAVVDFSRDQVAFLEGNGRGRFAVPILAPVGHGPAAIAHGNFGGPAGNDLAIANRLSDDLTILYGDRRGNFVPGKTYMIVPRPSFLMVADTNGDGTPDLIAGSPLGESIAILTFHPETGLGDPVIRVLGETTQPAPAVDLDGDGLYDLITVDAGAGEVRILPGKKGGGFGTAQSFRVGRDPAKVATGDFDGDGALDLAVLHDDTAVVALLRNTRLDGKRPTAAGATTPPTTR
jgi:hypothetical protein